MPTTLTTGPSLSQRVRASCAQVVAHSQLVAIDHDALQRLAEDLRLLIPTEHPWPAAELDAQDEEVATLVLALDAINFGSGYHDIIHKRPGLSGAKTMAVSLREYVKLTGALTPERLRAITATDCSQIFGQHLDAGAVDELMLRFAVGLGDLGALLGDSGGAIGLIRAAERSAEALAGILAAMPYYRDVARLDGEPVAFYKRAQITPADLCREFRRLLFDDLARLTAFADNLVPHVLRVDGVLRYDPTLARSIDQGELLDPGGRPEIEIRAAAVVCVERLASSTDRAAMDLDLLLWERGGSPRYKAIPRHRSRSVFY